MFNLDFFTGKRILVTGHTGFKGSWLCKILIIAGADLYGCSLNPPTKPSLFEISDIGNKMHSYIIDVRNYNSLFEIFQKTQPEIVIHMAAQPLVREGYANPVYTYETNVIGTVNILECIRNSTSVKSFLNVTTDKVYDNKEWVWGYREDDVLNGHDPYSNSKSCSELVTMCYKRSFFDNKSVAISTARAGNVIGGGDFSDNRIIPDCIRAAINNEDINIRNPYSIRPYQHVLEPLYVYLMIVAKQYNDKKYEGSYNVGPDESDCIMTERLVDLFVHEWGNNLRWVCSYNKGPHEANLLKLDCSMLKSAFDWSPRWTVDDAIKKTVEWTKCWLAHEDINECMDRQINEFFRYKNEVLV
ncbi:MAG: CDP-glucose 4,6-dehydratase [Clostridiales bacterium]|nr:CDP-glucose 4,6-dehydratase [Clostridiales bacterium]